MFCERIFFRRAKADRPASVCSLCAQDIYAGERAWFRNGVTVCEDCFTLFAQDALKPYEIVIGGIRCP